MQGIIKHWSPRGFGFISRDDGDRDVFTHVSEFDEYRRAGSDYPKPGLRVGFDVKPSPHPGKDPVACNVRSLDADGKPRVVALPARRRSTTEGADLMASVFRS